MNPLLLQVTIGVGAFLLGALFATVFAWNRLRHARRALREQADDHAAAIAVKKLRIRELEAKLAESPSGPESPTEEAMVEKLESLQKLMPLRVDDPTWMTGRLERPQSSAPRETPPHQN